MTIRLASACCALLVALALILGPAGAAHALFGDNELETEAKCAKLAKEAVRGEYKIVETEELKQWIDSGKEMLIVDTMPYEASYKKNHIPGAEQFLFPVPEMTEWDAQETGGKGKDEFTALLGPDTDRLLVFYCGFVKCTRSHNGAMWASKLGYTNVYRHPGGIKAWMEADYPIESEQ
jgi:rhodanese-related sulfurtransferase